MRRAFADRAQYLGDPDFVKTMPIDRLTVEAVRRASSARRSIPTKASKSSPTNFTWTHESDETTHFSIVDAQRNAVAVTYTLEAGYGSKIVAPGTGFLLNNEMGDFNAGPGLTNEQGLIGTEPNLARPGKRMLSSMSPTIVAKDGKLFMVTGSPGGRTIINTVLMTILERHRLRHERAGSGRRRAHPPSVAARSHQLRGVRLLAPTPSTTLKAMGHTVQQAGNQGVAHVIVYNQKEDMLEGGARSAGVRRRRCGEVAVGAEVSKCLSSEVPGSEGFELRRFRGSGSRGVLGRFRGSSGGDMTRVSRWAAIGLVVLGATVGVGAQQSARPGAGDRGLLPRADGGEPADLA